MSLLPLALSAEAPRFSTRLVLAGAALARRAGGLWTAIRHRGEVKQLLELDERSLRDIGLLRNDVVGALSEPIAVDPSLLLSIRTIEARGRVRAIRPAPTRSPVS